MKTIRNIALAICVILVAVGGVFCIVGAVSPDFSTGAVPNFLIDNGTSVPFRVGSALVGVLALVLSVGSAVLSLRRGSAARHVSFSSSLGEVRVSLDTLENALARGSTNLADVRKLQPRLSCAEGSKKIDCDAVASVYLGRNVREICESVSQFVATTLKQMLGVEEVGKVNITVKEVQEAEHIGHPPASVD